MTSRKSPTCVGWSSVLVYVVTCLLCCRDCNVSPGAGLTNAMTNECDECSASYGGWMGTGPSKCRSNSYSGLTDSREGKHYVVLLLGKVVRLNVPIIPPLD